MDQQRFKIRVEKVYANSYHQNLLLHLPKLLHMNKQITSISLRRIKPQTESYILQWEDYNGVFLPNDVKDFYLAHDGFLFLWMYNAIPEKLPVQCGINVNSLNDLDAITGYEVTPKAGISMKNGRKALSLSVNSKVFELEPLSPANETCVCLVYYNVWLRPTVWLWSKTDGFFFLSKDFSTYFRMCIAHLGIIGWQYTFTTMVLPKWTRRIMRKLAPHLLRSPYDYHIVSQTTKEQQKQTKETTKEEHKGIQANSIVGEKNVIWQSRNQLEDQGDVLINKLDANVFVNMSVACASWVNLSSRGAGPANSIVSMLNNKKPRPLSVCNNVRSNGALKKGRPNLKNPHSSRSTTGSYSRRFPVSPKILKRSKYGKK